MADASSGFPGLTGHERVTDLLARAIQRGRLHHGLLIVGPRGVGKTSLARGLGCALLCPERPGLGCGTCVVCHRVREDRHTDVRWLVPDAKSKSGTIAGEQAKQIALASQHAPFEGRAHLVIIDPADRLNATSANALLKSIEEPPPGVHFALLTSNLPAVLPTLQSRCIALDLAPLPDPQVDAVLDAALRERGESLPPERRRLAIELAQGSPGVAIELALDPSLEPLRGVLAAMLRAADQGPSLIFAGEKSPLWSAWAEAVRSQPFADDDDDDEPVPVVQVKGKGKRSSTDGKARKPKKRKDSELMAPARQRQTAMRVTDLWLIHLRERLRGRDGLAGMPALRREEPRHLSRAIQRVQALQDSIHRNPNVRLALEQTLLELSA